MRIGVLGINYKSSDLKVRELLAKTAQAHLVAQYWNLRTFTYVLLSTCNRTEIYFSADDLAAAHTELIHLLRQDVDLSFEHSLYSYFGSECYSHLTRVTAGFDSIIFGEAEIQNQVKKAYENACQYQRLSSCMHYMFQKALKVAKQIRSQFHLPRNKASLQGVVSDLTKAFFPLRSPSILFVGNSEINRLVLSYLHSKGWRNLHMTTRSPSAASPFLDKAGAQLLPWEDLQLWVRYDMIVCGTSHSEFLLKKEHCFLFTEPGSVIPASLIIDLSMPRSVDPQISKHPHISLFNIEEMNSFVSQKQKMNRLEKEQLTIVLDQVIAAQLACYHQKCIKGSTWASV